MMLSTGIFGMIAAVQAIMPTKLADGFRDDGRVFST